MHVNALPFSPFGKCPGRGGVVSLNWSDSDVEDKTVKQIVWVRRVSILYCNRSIFEKECPLCSRAFALLFVQGLCKGHSFPLPSPAGDSFPGGSSPFLSGYVSSGLAGSAPHHGGPAPMASDPSFRAPTPSNLQMAQLWASHPHEGNVPRRPVAIRAHVEPRRGVRSRRSGALPDVIPLERIEF